MSFILSAPAAFESALVTLGKVAIEGSRVRLTDGSASLVAEVSVEGAGLEITTDTINQPPHPTRVALRCAGDVKTATVRTVVKPA